MQFDDYNYNAFNHYVLVKDPENPSKRLDELEARISLDKAQSKSDKDDVSSKRQISERDLYLVDIQAKYFIQDAITIEPSPYEQALARADHLETDANQEEAVEPKPKVPADDDEDPIVIAKVTDGETQDLLYNIYFEDTEIEQIKNCQNDKVFDDLMKLR